MNCQTCFSRPTCRHYNVLVLDLEPIPVKTKNFAEGQDAMKKEVFAGVANHCAYYVEADFLPFDNSKENPK
jgi:hypothetical protein